MNKDEKKLAEKLRQVLAPHGHFQRIEPYNDKGIPDVNFCFNDGSETWIELKAKANKDGSVVIRKEQFAWGEKRAKSNGAVVVLAGDPEDSSRVYGYRFPIMKPFQTFTPLKSGVKLSGASNSVPIKDLIEELPLYD